MNYRTQAYLIHGLGESPTFWDPLVSILEEMEIAPQPVSLPPIDAGGPESWAQTVLNQMRENNCLLIGHSLGAVVGLAVAQRRDVESCILLGMPIGIEDMELLLPQGLDLSLTAAAKCSLFIQKITKRNKNNSSMDIIHIIGEKDPHVSAQEFKGFSISTTVVPDVGHAVIDTKQGLATVVSAIAHSQCAVRSCDPGKRQLQLKRFGDSNRRLPHLNEVAPMPARLDLEITTACQCECSFCARTTQKKLKEHSFMSLELFQSIIGHMPTIKELFFVGLGEPLLHQDIHQFVTLAHQRGIKTRLVTNGILATETSLKKLQQAGLEEITFSIDSKDPALFTKLRGGADLTVVLKNLSTIPMGIKKSLFLALSKENIKSAVGVVDIACDHGIPAIGLTNLNFKENQNNALHPVIDRSAIESLIEYAYHKRVLLVGPHMHNSDNIEKYHAYYTVKRSEDVLTQPVTHTNCLAPWRSAVISADGVLSPCNCAPEVVLGSLKDNSFVNLWNGAPFLEWRDDVKMGQQECCQVCPRY